MSNHADQPRPIQAEIKAVRREIASLDMRYAENQMHKVNEAADRSLSTLPPHLQKPFLEIMQIAQHWAAYWRNG